MTRREVELWIQTSLERRDCRVKQLIGRGTFGKVYLVENGKKGMQWACKSANTIQARQLLRREADMLAQIQHPVFPRFEQLIEEAQGSLLLMEYVEGESLADKLERGALLQKELLDWALQLAEGLCYLHKLPQPVLYRDLKPENVKIRCDGQGKLLDLGCACKLAEVRFSKAGTRGYAPPEQLVGEQTGGYSDVYAFGKLLYYMVTGENPCRLVKRKNGLSVGNKSSDTYLMKLIEGCTKENFQERIQDMDCVWRNLKKCGREEYFLYESIVK